jgi:hypothetical protein
MSLTTIIISIIWRFVHMRARTIPTLLIIATFVLVTAVQARDKGPTDAKKATTAQAVAAAKFACPMHPEVTADKAGKCSNCGMELTKKATATMQKAKSSMKKKGDKGCCSGSCSEPCEEK